MQTDLSIQSAAQKSVIDALEVLGCKIEEFISGTGVLFTYGGQYYIALPSEDLTYLCVIFPKFTDVSEFPSLAAANEAIHDLNARVKLARLWIDHGQLHASSETILDPSMALGRILSRLLSTLQTIVLEVRIRQRISVAQNEHPEPNNLPNSTPRRVVALH